MNTHVFIRKISLTEHTDTEGLALCARAWESMKPDEREEVLDDMERSDIAALAARLPSENMEIVQAYRDAMNYVTSSDVLNFGMDAERIENHIAFKKGKNDAS